MKIPRLNPYRSKLLLGLEVSCLLLLSLSVYMLSMYFAIESPNHKQVLAPNAQNTVQQIALSKAAQNVATSPSRKADPWQVLIHQLSISTNTLQSVAPHFPERFSANFTKERKVWTQTYPREVKAVLGIPAVKSLQPSHIALEIQGLIPRDEIYNPFWYMYNNYPEQKAKIDRIAPHFPQPNRSLDIDEQERTYKIAFRSWADNYPREFEAYRLITMN